MRVPSRKTATPLSKSADFELPLCYVMLHRLRQEDIVIMARGDSGRIVVEIDPNLKDELYTQLKRNGYTLKDWFLDAVDGYLQTADQLDLDLDPQHAVTSTRRLD